MIYEVTQRAVPRGMTASAARAVTELLYGPIIERDAAGRPLTVNEEIAARILAARLSRAGANMLRRWPNSGKRSAGRLVGPRAGSIARPDVHCPVMIRPCERGCGDGR